MDWINKVKNNIFPFSNEKNKILLALQEWEYRGGVFDPEYPQEQCQLCGQQDIRYQFEIVNKINTNSLLIGSECIKRFDIKVIDQGGAVLTGKSAYQKIDKDKRKLITDAKIRSVLNSLVNLSKKDYKFEIENFVKYYQKRGAFTPAQLFTIIWRFEENKVNYNKSHFKVVMRREREKDQLRYMEDWKLSKIMPCLTKKQKEFIDSNKKNQAYLKKLLQNN